MTCPQRVTGQQVKWSNENNNKSTQKSKLLSNTILTNAECVLRWYRRVNSFSSTSGTRRVAFATHPAFSHESKKDRIVITYNKRNTSLLIRERYYVTVNQIMVVITTNPWVSSFLPISNPVTMKSWQVPQSLKYRINETYMHYVYRGSRNVTTYIWKIPNRKLQSSLLSLRFVLNQSSLSMSMCR